MGYNGIFGGTSNTICCQQYTFIIGSNINADRECTTFVNNLSIMGLPNSPSGLPSGSLYYNTIACTVMYVP